MLFGNYDKNHIINKFKDNQKLFNGVINELKEYDTIRFEVENGYVTIISNEPESNKTILSLDDKSWSKNASTIKLIKKMKIESVYKQNQNIEFQFKSTLQSLKSIIYLPNIKNWPDIDYVIKQEKIVDSWYYIESR